MQMKKNRIVENATSSQMAMKAPILEKCREKKRNHLRFATFDFLAHVT